MSEIILVKFIIFSLFFHYLESQHDDRAILDYEYMGCYTLLI